MNIKLLAKAAFLTAVCYVATAFMQLPLPGGSGAYINFGQTVIFLLPTFLPLEWAVFSGVAGCVLADLTLGGAYWLPATIIIKAAMIIAKDKIPSKWAGFAVGIIILAAGYYLYDSAFIAQNYLSTLPSLGFYLLEGAVCAVIAQIIRSAVTSRK